MSKVGKWLLENCSNEISIDLKAKADEISSKGWTFARVRATCIMLGVTIIGGS